MEQQPSDSIQTPTDVQLLKSRVGQDNKEYTLELIGA